MTDSNLYRLVARATTAFLAISILAGVSLFALGVTVSGWLIIIFIAVVSAALFFLGHFRMRMIFASFRATTRQSQDEILSKVSNIGSLINSSIAKSETRDASDSDTALNDLKLQLDDCVREIVANDSFSAVRHNESINNSEQLETELASTSSALFGRLDQLERTVSEELAALVHTNEQFREFSDHHAGIVTAFQDLAQGSLDSMAMAAEHISSDLVDMRNRWEAYRSDDGAQKQRAARAAVEARAELADQLAEVKFAGASMGSALSAAVEKSSRDVESMTGSLTAVATLVDHIKNSQIAVLGRLGAGDEDSSVDSSKLLATKADLEDIRGSFALHGKASAVEAARYVNSSNSDISNQIETIHSSLRNLQAHVDESFGSSVDRLGNSLDSRLDSLTGGMDSRFSDFRELSQNLFNATQSKLQQLRISTEELPKDIVDYSFLVERFGIDAIDCPRIGGWAATVPAIAALVEEILGRPAVENVLDVGSGASTIWSALAMRERGYGKCYALEHDPRFATSLRDKLSSLQLENWAEVIHAPLVDWSPSTDYRDQEFELPSEWYSTDGIKHIEFDAVFVDGPPGSKHVVSRLPALDVLHRQLRDDCLVVLDDTIRVEEKAIVSMWRKREFDRRCLELVSMLSKSTVLRLVSGPGDREGL